MADTLARPNLLELAAKRFDTISPAEQKLLEATEKGERADYGADSGERGVIRSDRLSWLCTDPNAAARVTYRGVLIVGAEIVGEVDLEWAKILFPLRIWRCVFKEAIVLQSSHLISLNLASCSIRNLRAENLITDHNVTLSAGFEAEGTVDLTGATIGGNLDCAGGKFISKSEAPALIALSAKVEGNVFLGNGLRAEGGVNLIAVTIGGSLDCDGGQFVSKSEALALDANAAKVERHVFLRNGFRAEGGVGLVAVTIGRSLDCDGGQFVSKSEAPALHAGSGKIQGGVLLNHGFRAEGGVNLVAATIGGGLACDGGWFVSKGEAPALDARSANIQGFVLLKKGFVANGRVSLECTTIVGNLDCTGGQFVSNSNETALSAFGAEIQGYVFLCKDFEQDTGFKADGGVDLKGARIRGDLICNGGEFVAPSWKAALDADGARIDGKVLLRNGFKALPKGSVQSSIGPIEVSGGGVIFRAATIGRNLECDGSEFVGKGQAALNANSAKIQGHVYLRGGFKAEGGVDLTAATIGGSMACENGAKFVGGFIDGKERRPAISAGAAKVDGNVFFRMVAETIVPIEQLKGVAVDGKVVFSHAFVGGSFQWQNIESPEKAILDLRFTKVGTLRNDKDAWPSPGNLKLDGFVYDQIADEASPSAKVQLGWLKLQPPDRFLSQPFEQLDAVLLKMGLEEDARKVMIAKNEEHRRHLHAPIWDRQRPWDWVSSLFEWCWYQGLGRIIGYGYHPWNAFVISLIVICVGWLAFERGYHSNLVTPTGDNAYVIEKDGTRRLSKHGTPQFSEDYPRFNAFVYSAETFVPLLKLGIGERWTPNAHRGAPLKVGILGLLGFPRTWGSLLRYYLWFHIIAGWVLTTLWVGGLTGLVKT